MAVEKTISFRAFFRQFTSDRWILKSATRSDPWKEYDRGAEIGEGVLSTVYSCRHKPGQTGQPEEEVAIKIISKSRLSCTLDGAKRIRNEVELLHLLGGHRNIVDLKATYEDKQNIYIVMDRCYGDLHTYVALRKQNRTFTERAAAALMREIVTAVAHCHAMGVAHCDLTISKCMMVESSDSTRVKIVDFTVSSKFKEDEMLSEVVGSKFFKAPEQLRGSYSKEADIWSCGVILYFILSGVLPFMAQPEDVDDMIANQPVDCTSDPGWVRVSAAAKDLIRKMLDKNPRARPTTQAILQHEWLRENGVALDTPLEPEVLTRMKKFGKLDKLKKRAMMLLASTAPTEDVKGLKELFGEMDIDASGTISASEMGRILRLKGAVCNDQELGKIMRDADISGDGEINIYEFLGAAVNTSKLLDKDNLRKAFSVIDKDNSGQISKAELIKAMAKVGFMKSQVEELMMEVDKDGNGVLDFDEFCDMMTYDE